jgi:hypothetical protein
MSDDIDFEALMRREGVQQLDSTPSPRRPAPVASKLDSRPPRKPVAAAAPAPERPPADARALETRVAELEARDRRLSEELRALREALDAEKKENARLDAERRGLQRRLEARPRDEAGPSAGSGVTLAALLEARGLAQEDEQALALTALLEARPRELLEAATLAEPASVRALLDDRLALLCDDPACSSSSASTTVVPVPSSRCEVCGGSDIRRAFARFTAACAQSGVRRITIVGGSPAYRTQLEKLAADAPQLSLSFVRGDKKPGKKAAAQIAKGADLVVIWGSTILDHSTSDAFKRRQGLKMNVAVRGISSMLAEVATRLG